MGRNKDINLKRIADIEQTVTAKIKITSYFEACQQAAQCYASQTPSGCLRLPNFLSKWLFQFDMYTRAVPPFETSRLERDLFAGIDEA